ncbi:hypothetical protein ACFLQL_00100 [Verrucomicrobiota bacterium]
MKKLLSKSNGGPLPSSLFWMDGPKVESTWEVLREGIVGTDYNNRLANKQEQYGSRLYTFYTYHAGDPDCVVNPWVGNPDAAEVVARYHNFNPVPLDTHKWETLWKPIFKKGLHPNVFLVPTAMCGDDTNTTCNVAFLHYYLPSFIIGLYPYVVGYNLASEATKSMKTAAQMEQAVAIMKHAFVMKKWPPKPILVHIQCNREGELIYPANADIIMLETSNHPKYGNDRSPADMVAEIVKVLSHLPPHMYLWVQETNFWCETANARAQVRAIIELAKTDPRLIGLPGPR